MRRFIQTRRGKRKKELGGWGSLSSENLKTKKRDRIERGKTCSGGGEKGETSRSRRKGVTN